MRHVTLQAIREEWTGETGMIVKGTPRIQSSIISTEGVVIAHDLLEHCNGIKSIGSVDDELEALGACWFIRGQHGYLRPEAINDPVDGLARDVAMLADYYVRGGVPFHSTVPNTRPCIADAYLEDIVNEAEHFIYSELRHQVDHVGPYVDKVREFLDASLHYMRTGYRKAHKRFKGNGNLAHSMFWDIARAVDPYAKHCEFEGQEYRLSYDRHGATCEEFYPEW